MKRFCFSADKRRDMYLKSIEVQGFKSFAQKICFEFHNGITAIVGPNGSGKSNVADAVRWVLGEQSARQLRGGHMQDVIFSGTENRKPLSYAAVAITLDNGDHKLPVSFEEVTVARRLYRSGESEYLLNGSACRLKDIQEMFYDTGIGKEGYSIIGQGQIDRILSGKPEERRELFDEAAGIVKFKRRKITALKKLADEKQNLQRVTDILHELSRQLGPLGKQAEKARIYLAKKEELKRRDVRIFLLETTQFRRQLKEQTEKSRIAQGDLEEATRQFEKTRTEYEALEKKLADLDEKIEHARSQAQECTLLRQQMEGRANVLEEQIRTARNNAQHYESRIAAVEEELQTGSDALKGREAEKQRLAEDIKRLEGQRQKRQKEQDSLRREIEDCSREIEDGKNEIIEILNRRANTKGKMQRYDTMTEQMQLRQTSLNQKALLLKSEDEQLKESQKEAQASCDQATRRMECLTDENRRAVLEIQRISAAMQEQKRRLEEGQGVYHREASRLESLKNLAERYDGYGNSIRRVMEQKKDAPGIHGVVADLIQVDKDYEIAIETALGGSIQNIVTDCEQTAKQLIEYLKKNRFGRATFLPLTSVRSRGGFGQKEALKEPGAIGPASSLVRADPIYRELVGYLLGKTLVVENMERAIAIGKKYRHSLRMVTLEGESFSPGGSMTGGVYKNSSNLLGRRREIEELTAAVKSRQTQLQNLREELQKNRDQRNVLRREESRTQEELQEITIRQNAAQINLSQQKEKAKEIKEKWQRLERERQELAGQMQELTKTAASIQKELDASGQEEKQLESFIEDRQKELESIQQKAQEGQKILEEDHVQRSALRQKADFLQTDIQRIQQERKKLKEEQAQLEGSLQTSRQETEQKEQEICALQKSRQKAEADAAQSQEKAEKHIKEREQLSGSHKAYFQKQEELSRQMGLLDKESFRLHSQIEKLEDAQETRINALWEEYELTPSDASKYAPEEGQTDASGTERLKKDIAELRKEIRQLGDVNVNAIEDYKELQERHTFLSEQHADLTAAEKTLLQIIDDLDAGMRRQFAQKFKEIQREFNKAFRELFGGGKGALELLDDGDILEAGIKIISQPPGKKLQNMMQLSGGEKALTAIALLFAIQNLKPSPFCLLDEIEAALDDSNVARFAQYVHKLTKNTQFIIITHRRGTMNAADRLYGITMQEKGVSALVSVDLVESDLDK